MVGQIGHREVAGASCIVSDVCRECSLKSIRCSTKVQGS